MAGEHVRWVTRRMSEGAQEPDAEQQLVVEESADCDPGAPAEVGEPPVRVWLHGPMR